MRFLGLLVGLFLVAGGGQTPAPPTVPAPTVIVQWDASDDWARKYDDKYPTLNGQPFIRDFTVTATPNGGGGAITTTIPRKSIVELKNAAGVVTTLEARDVPIAVGAGSLRLFATSQEGRVSEGSNVVPFSGVGPRPAVPASLRLVLSP